MERKKKQIYHIEPVYTESLWGGQQLSQLYGYQREGFSNIGEVYNVIAMPGQYDCEVIETKEKLSEFYINNPEVFKCEKDYMPLRAAMACTKIPMSIQVHPSNEYALEHDNQLGKPDGVYVIAGAGSCCFGHYAKTRAEFKQMVNDEKWEDLLRYIPINTGDFLDMPYGTLHALGADMIYIEFSQNADLTYRLYDYNRQMIDPKTGEPRTIHREKVIECVNIPDADTKVEELSSYFDQGCEITLFHDEPGLYTCGKIVVEKQGFYQREEFYYLVAIAGSGTVAGVDIKAGETLLIPADFKGVEINGEITLCFLTYTEVPKGEN